MRNPPIASPRPSSPLQIVPLTPKYEGPFYYLIQEQQEEHHDPVRTQQELNRQHALYRSIVDEKRAEAFLVISPETGRALTALTYYDCVSTHGRGVYLEDIVTTQRERNRGAGKFAMAALAQIATQRSADIVVWECSLTNKPAHQFYDSLDCERCNDRHTWRFLGALTSPTKPEPHFSVVATGANPTNTLAKGEIVDISNDHPHAFKLSTLADGGWGVGHLMAYRSYSTFRIVNGVHIEAVDVPSENPAVVAAMFHNIGEIQRQNGWQGHVDITVRETDEKFLLPLLRTHGFSPLAYGDSRMIVRRIKNSALKQLAMRPGHSIIDGLEMATPCGRISEAFEFIL